MCCIPVILKKTYSKNCASYSRPFYFGQFLFDGSNEI